MRDLAGLAGRTVRLCGWAQPVAGRLTLRDYTGAVDLAGGPDDVLAESAIEVHGLVATDARSVEVGDLQILGPSLGPPPVDASSPLEARLDWRAVDLRRPRNRLIFEVQTTLERAMREWWAAQGFVELHSPKLRSMPNQSGRELFSTEYFGRRAYLAQSPQFYKQMAMCAGLERVFEIGPVFRANPLLTTRHDTEFTSVDVEVSWIDAYEDLLAIEEDWLTSALAAVADRHGADIERLFGTTLHVPETPFPRVTMAEAQAVLTAAGHQSNAEEGDIDPAGERLLGEHVAAESGSEFVFVTEYPESVRPFYHMRLSPGSALTRSFDLLWKGLEVTTGAQREHRHPQLEAQAARNPARVDVIRPYLNFFRYGCPPHGGFGVGLTRLLMCIFGVEDVREVTFLPRDRSRLEP